MTRSGTVVLLSTALGFLLFLQPAEGTQSASLAPRVKGVVIARSDRGLIVDQVLAGRAGQSRTARVVLTAHTRVAGRRTSASTITVHDLVRADGAVLGDGSLEAVHVEVILTAEEATLSRRTAGGVPGLFWQWVLHGRLTIPGP